MRTPLQHGVRVLASQVRRQAGHPAPVQPAVAEHLEKDRFSRAARAAVSDDLGLDAPRLLHELEQLQLRRPMPEVFRDAL